MAVRTGESTRFLGEFCVRTVDGTLACNSSQIHSHFGPPASCRPWCATTCAMVVAHVLRAQRAHVLRAQRTPPSGAEGRWYPTCGARAGLGLGLGRLGLYLHSQNTIIASQTTAPGRSKRSPCAVRTLSPCIQNAINRYKIDALM